MALTKIGILRDFVSTGIDDNATATAITIDADENIAFANGVTVTGNLQVDGTTTTINSTTLTVEDKNIVLASGANNSSEADGSGITVEGASATLTYGSTNDAWSFNKDLGIGVANPAQRLDVREEKIGGGVLVQIYNEDNSDTTTQAAGIAMGPDTRGATARITAVKENASFATNAGRDVALTFSSVLNNTPTEAMRILSSGDASIGSTSNHAGARVVINDTPPTAFGSPMLQVGQETFTASGVYSIGLGYTAASYTEPPAEIAAVATSSSGGTTADIIFGTRSVTTNTAVTERMRITSSGNLIVGDTSAGNAKVTSVNGVAFEARDGTQPFYQWYNSAAGTDLKYWRVGNNTNGDLQWQTVIDAYSSATVRMTLDASGNLLVGKTSPATNVEGGELRENGQVLAVATDINPFFGARLGSNGDLAVFRKDSTTVGSIGSEGGDSLYIQGGTTAGAGLLCHGSAAKILPVRNGASIDDTIDLGQDSRRFKDLYLSGDIQHKDNAGNARVLYDRSADTLGNQGTNGSFYSIYLGGTAGTNRMDDYEEGDWSPTITGSSGASGQSYSAQRGRYRKIGNVVHITFDVELSNAGSISGTYIVLGGLPFSGDSPNVGGGIITTYSSGWGSGLVEPILGYISGSNCYLMEGGSTGSDYILESNNFHTNSSRLIGFGTIIVP
jgi:hypothetical protein